MEQNTNNQSTALLVMDIQDATIKMLKNSEPFIVSVTKAIQTARSSKIPVIYIV